MMYTLQANRTFRSDANDETVPLSFIVPILLDCPTYAPHPLFLDTRFI